MPLLSVFFVKKGGTRGILDRKLASHSTSPHPVVSHPVMDNGKPVRMALEPPDRLAMIINLAVAASLVVSLGVHGEVGVVVPCLVLLDGEAVPGPKSLEPVKALGG